MKLNVLHAALLASACNLGSALAAPNGTSTDIVFVADYSGLLHTVRFEPSDSLEGKGTLTSLHSTRECGESPTWLFKGPAQRLWCTDEAQSTGNGSLNQFDIAADGLLTRIDHLAVSGSPVQAVFAFNNSTIMTAIYSSISGLGTGGGLQQVSITSGSFTVKDPVPFLPVGVQGQAPPEDLARAHGVANDLTGRYVAMPDFGADKVRIMALVEDGTALQHTEAALNRGSGPRHAVFFNHTSGVGSPYLFVVSEKANSITTFNVTYTNDTMSLALSRVTSIFDSTKWAGNKLVNETAKAAEIKISPDNRYLVVSNRNVTDGQTAGNWDSLSTYSINADGSLQLADYKELIEPFYPRAFDIHPLGDKVVVVGQKNSIIAVYARDVASGKIGDMMASLKIEFDGVSLEMSHAIWHQI